MCTLTNTLSQRAYNMTSLNRFQAFLFCMIGFNTHTAYVATLPIKRAPSEVVAFEEASRSWLKDHFARRKLEIKTHLPLVSTLIDIITEYDHPYSDQSCTVQVWRFQNYHTPERSPRYKHKLIFHVPLRKNGRSFELWEKDVFRACGGAFGALMRKIDRCHTADSQEDQTKFQEFWEEHIAVTEYGSASSPLPIIFPSCKHLPLTIYWQHDPQPLTNNTQEGLVEQWGDQYSKSIREACYDILLLHKRLTPQTTPSELLVFCSACRGNIPAHRTFYHLTIRHSYLPVQSKYCTGINRLCRAYRALIIFPQKSYKKRKIRS